jgi:hypothetical protein
MANELNKWFSKEKIQMVNKYMKECSTTFAIKEMPIKTTLQFHFTPVRWQSSKKQTINTRENWEWEYKLV